MIRVEADRIIAATATLTATFERGVLVSLVRQRDGARLLEAAADGVAPLSLVYAGQESVPLGGQPGDHVVCLALNPRRAQVRVHGWNGDGVIDLAEDPATGDLVVEPSGYASRPGLLAVRWTIPGLAPELELVAPFFQGVRLPLEDELVRNSHWAWPHQWEAGLAILQGPSGGAWVHCRDERFRYKALQVGDGERARCLALDTENYGPLHDRLAAGGLAWRLNVHDGGWQGPADAYRTWLEETWRPRPRPGWLVDVGFAVSWCPTDPQLLDALAARLEPRRVLLHVPNWRTDGYDENYPTFEASAEGRAFIDKALGMGFRTLPHFNAIDMDPSHPVYDLIRDFQYRDVTSRRVQGWTWVDGKVMPVPESNAGRLGHRDKKAMIKVHPGLGMWRSVLTERVRGAADDLSLEAAFLDVTLCTWNLHNCLVEDTTPTEGMARLLAQVADTGLVLGGEGRNETTALDQSFAQVHLFRSWQGSTAGLERVGRCALNEHLFGRWCRSFGYSGLSGRGADEATRMGVHVALGAMPTVTVRSAADIAQPNGAVAQMLDRAR